MSPAVDFDPVKHPRGNGGKFVEIHNAAAGDLGLVGSHDDAMYADVVEAVWDTDPAYVQERFGPVSSRDQLRQLVAEDIDRHNQVGVLFPQDQAPDRIAQDWLDMQKPGSPCLVVPRSQPDVHVDESGVSSGRMWATRDPRIPYVMLAQWHTPVAFRDGRELAPIELANARESVALASEQTRLAAHVREAAQEPTLTDKVRQTLLSDAGTLERRASKGSTALDGVTFAIQAERHMLGHSYDSLCGQGTPSFAMSADQPQGSYASWDEALEAAQQQARADLDRGNPRKQIAGWNRLGEWKQAHA